MEAQSNKKIQRVAKSMGWMLQRHEDKFAMGVPDLSFVSTYKTGWIEVKFTRGDQKLKIRPAQIHWMCDRAKNDIFRAYLVCECDDKWLAAQIVEEDRRTMLDGIKPSTFNRLERAHEGTLPEVLSFIQN
jgi:hypothetical protein